MTSSITRFNTLMSEIGATYHEISKRLDLTDSAFNIMYVVYDNEGSYPLSGIVKMTCISKQTVNSSLRNLESEGLVYLEKQDRASYRGGTQICRTDREDNQRRGKCGF